MQENQKVPTIRESVPLTAFVLALGLLSACGTAAEPEAAGELTQALNVCDETVPANRSVDGIPAYAQCDSTTDAIWSNNGVDTSSTSQGAGWVKTQQGGGYQCTELAWRYMHFKWGVDYRSGNAGSWCDGKLPATLTKTTVPVHGDLIVFAPGSCGADTTTGHIAVVDVVNAAGDSVTLVEQNRAGRRSSKVSCALCFLHAVANNGSGSGGTGGTGSGGATGSAGSAPAAGNGAGGAAGSATTGGTPGQPSGGASAESGSSAGGGAPTSTAGAGSLAGGPPSESTAGASGASASPGGAAALAGSSPDAPESASCSTRQGAPPSTSLIPYALVLAGLVARRRMLGRKAADRSE